MPMMRRQLAAAMVVTVMTGIAAVDQPGPRPPALGAPVAPLCAPDTARETEPAPGAPNRPDWLLDQHRYIELSAWLSTAAARGNTPAATLEYVRGVLANKRNQNQVSIAYLEPLLTHLDPIADSARSVVVLKTLADDYMKTYRYGDAANALARVEREHAASLTADDRTDIASETALRRAIAKAPPQRVSIPAPFAVALKPDALGLREVDVRVGRDSSSWIFDTGANLSTVTESTARQLGLHVIASAAKTNGITGAGVPTKLAVIPEMRMGGATVYDAIVLVLPDSALDIPQMHFQIRAILGYPVLEALGRLAIGRDSLRVDPQLGETLSDSANLYLENLSPLVAATVGDTTRLFHFDSGADATVLTVRFCRSYSTLLTGLDTTHLKLGGAGGVLTYTGYTLAKLPLAIGGTDAVLDSVFVFRDVSKSPFESYYGNLSATLAARFGGYTIDFRAMTFTLGTKGR